MIKFNLSNPVISLNLNENDILEVEKLISGQLENADSCAILLLNGTNLDGLNFTMTAAKLVQGVVTNMAIQLDGNPPFESGHFDSVTPFIFLTSDDHYVS